MLLHTLAIPESVESGQGFAVVAAIVQSLSCV